MNNAAKTPRYNVEEYYQAIQNSEQPTELLDGELVAMASPSIQHQRICGNLQFFIKQYIRRNHRACEVFTAPTDVQLDDHNLVIPDVFIACHPDWFDSQKYNGAPDFVAEVVSTNRSDDLTGSCGFIGFMAFGSTGLLTRSMKKYWFISLRKVRSRTCIRLIRRFRFGFTRMQNIRCQLSFRNCFKCLECIVQ